MIILLDSGPLGLVSNPRKTGDAESARQWMRELLVAGHRVLVPAIADYEVRRELKLQNKASGLIALDEVSRAFGFVDLTRDALLRASDLWASARQAGMPTADRQALDGDVILAAQALTLIPGAWGQASETVLVATTNVGHLERFVDARHWQNIPSE